MKHKNTIVLLAALVLLLLVQRGSLILFGYSHISHPGIDEPVSGVLPCDILDAQLRAPLFAYEYLNRSGDVLIEGLLLVPYFKTLGRGIFSTKMFALTSALITFLCWFMFLRRYQGLLPAVLFGLLFALPPTLFARQSLIGTISSHHMLNPLIVAQSMLLFRIFEQGREAAGVRAWLWIGSGVVAGLGIYTFYSYILFLGFCFLFFLLFMRQSLRPRSITWLAIGGVAGFAPWVLRAVSSHAGGQFLSAMVKNISIDWWSFVQNFGFAVPHSLGYNYPARAVGFISILFYLFIILAAGIILKHGLGALFHRETALRQGLSSVSAASVQGLFCALFPLFFLVCFSLSPMRITPFEYWPSIGLFATFGVADPIRYRWLHILFPFYFAAIAIGTALFFRTCGSRTLRALMLCAFLFFIACGTYKSIALCSGQDYGRIFNYRGYNYDQFAPKFILGDFAPRSLKEIQALTAAYPLEHRGEAYKFYGMLLAGKIIAGRDAELRLQEVLRDIPEHYMKNVIWGIVCIAQGSPEDRFKPLQDYLSQTYPAFYYENWGYRYLGYKYYGVLANEEVLLQHIPAVEQWFYKNYLNKFKQEFADNSSVSSKRALFDEINAIPMQYQAEVVKGLGMLVGAEMLFDTLQAPDYPLDSRFGEQLPAPLQGAFYEGVGCGFAETLCRFWRMLLIPEAAAATQRAKLLEGEWIRCHSLMSKLPQKNADLINRGFANELRERYLPPAIRAYVDAKLTNVL